MRPSVRLAALSESHVIYSWTHDSVGLGEDGPTHQPIEHLAALRAMPGLRVIRPADANETAHAWRIAVDSDGPTALVLSRQIGAGARGHGPGRRRRGPGRVRARRPTPGCTRRRAYRDRLGGVGVRRGGRDCSLAGADGPVRARVVSLPSWELFALQTEAYRDEVLPPGTPRLAVEAASSFGWERYADDVVAIDHFGASAPGAVVLEHFGYTPDNVAARARALLARLRSGHRTLTPIDRRGAPAKATARPEGSTMTKLHDLYEQQGQSPWLDNLRRDYVRGGRLAEHWSTRASGA